MTNLEFIWSVLTKPNWWLALYKEAHALVIFARDIERKSGKLPMPEQAFIDMSWIVRSIKDDERLLDTAWIYRHPELEGIQVDGH
jgi:hypothetical protein